MSIDNIPALLLCLSLCYLFLLCYFNKLHQTSYLPFYQYHLRHKRPRLISGFIPYVGVALQFSKCPYEYIQSLRQYYGEDIFTVYIMGSFMTFVCHPKDVSSIFNSPKNFEMHDLALEFSHKLFGVSERIYHMEDGVNDAAFKMITKYLQKDDLPVMTRKAQVKLEACLLEELGCAGEWKECDLEDFVFRLICDASTFALFGEGLPFEELRAKFRAFDEQLLILGSNMPQLVKKEAYKLRQRYIDMFKAPIHDNACNLVKARSDLYKGLVDENDAAALMMIINWVSLTNTISATFWSLYYLLKLPSKYREDIIEETRTILREVEHLKEPNSLLPPLTHELLNKMPKLDAVIDESLRMSTCLFVNRRAASNLKFTDRENRVYKFTRREHLMLVPSHTDEEIFENPSEFQPYRFLGKNERKWTKDGDPIKLSGAFMVFGGGLHACPGRFFAKNEMKLMVCVLLQTLDFELLTKGDAIPDKRQFGLFFTKPLNKISVKLRLNR